MAKALARRLIDLVAPYRYDAIISNAGGCGSHLRHYGHLLDDDRAYAAAKTAVKAAQEELSWGRIGEPLAELIERVASTPRQRSSGGGVLLRAAATLARSSLDRRGLRATVAAASRAISGGARR